MMVIFSEPKHTDPEFFPPMDPLYPPDVDEKEAAKPAETGSVTSLEKFLYHAVEFCYYRVQF